jgi:predicted nucleic acid-binding protein
VTLADTGPIVALLDTGDQYHRACTQTAKTQISPPLVTTWSCITEAMHLLGRSGGHHSQDELWEWFALGAIIVEPTAASHWPRLRQLMAKYATAPMDLGDATLVMTAERLRVRRIFTLDRHFRTYLINDRDPFDVVP